MIEQELHERIFSLMSYEDFRQYCQTIFQCNDNQIKDKFKEENISPAEIRNKYKKLYDTVTQEAFLNAKHFHSYKQLEKEALALVNERRIEEAIDKYKEVVEEAKKIINQEQSIKLINIGRVNIAKLSYQLNDYEEIVKQCHRVLLMFKLDIREE